MIASLQTLRFIFAICIFLHHFYVADNSLFPQGGDVGVSFFIILSGFVMSLGYYNKAASLLLNRKEYMIKRFIRVYPLHLLCLLFYLLINLSDLTPTSFLRLTPNLLLLQSWIPKESIYFSGNAVSWCLSDLIFFYCLLPFIIRAISITKKRNIALIACFLGLLYFIALLVIPESYAHAFLYISPIFRVYDFLIGIAIYKAYTTIKNSQLQNTIYNLSFAAKCFIETMLATILIAMIVFCPDNSLAYASYWWPILSILVIYFAVVAERGGIVSLILSNKSLSAMGTVSFTFYMIHQLAFKIMDRWLSHYDIVIAWQLKLAIYFIVVIAISYFVHNRFEKPITTYLNRKVYEKKSLIQG